MAACAVIVLSGCSDEPSAINSVGTELVRTKVTVKSGTFGALSSSTFKQYVSMDGITNLVGRSAGYVGYTLLQFYPSYLPERDTIHVLSATLNLRAVTWFGDSSGQLGFNVYAINRAWGQTTFRWDSLTSDFYNSDPGSIRGTFTGGVASDTEWVKVSLDTAMVRRWLQPLVYTDNYGVILVPTPAANIVRGIHEFELGADSLWPTLTVVATNLSGSITDTSTYKIGQDTFVGNFDNTTNPGLLYIQSGVSYRSRLLLDVSSIPRGAIVNEAQLVLQYDPAGSHLTKFTSDTSVVAHLSLSATDSSQFEVLGSRSTSSIPNGFRFVFDIRHQVQSWVRNQSLNYGLILRPSNLNEFSSFDLFTFFNQTAQDSSKRPQLNVIYTVQSN